MESYYEEKSIKGWNGSNLRPIPEAHEKGAVPISNART